MIVCVCQGVSDRVVRLTIAAGATTVDAVAARCGAGTDCGSCLHALQEIVDDASAAASLSCSTSCAAAAQSSPVAAGA